MKQSVAALFITAVTMGCPSVMAQDATVKAADKAETERLAQCDAWGSEKIDLVLGLRNADLFMAESQNRAACTYMSDALKQAAALNDPTATMRLRLHFGSKLTTCENFTLSPAERTVAQLKIQGLERQIAAKNCPPLHKTMSPKKP